MGVPDAPTARHTGPGTARNGSRTCSATTCSATSWTASTTSRRRSWPGVSGLDHPRASSLQPGWAGERFDLHAYVAALFAIQLPGIETGTGRKGGTASRRNVAA